MGKQHIGWAKANPLIHVFLRLAGPGRQYQGTVVDRGHFWDRVGVRRLKGKILADLPGPNHIRRTVFLKPETAENPRVLPLIGVTFGTGRVCAV